MFAKRLSGIERDQHSARRLVGAEDDRRASSARRFDLAQVPALHCADLKGPRQAVVRLKRLVSLAVNRYELGPIGTNCYVVRADDSAAEAVVVDPGADAARILDELVGLAAPCIAIFIKHGHPGHPRGGADLGEATGAPV